MSEYKVHSTYIENDKTSRYTFGERTIPSLLKESIRDSPWQRPGWFSRTSHIRRGWGSWECSAWRRPRDDVVSVYKYVLGECNEEGTRLFSVVSSDRTQDNVHKLKYRKFHLHIRNSISSHIYCEGGQMLKQIAQRGSEISVDLFKTWAGMVLDNPL